MTPSQFTHEAEGLNLIRALLPERDPFRAWSNFEFRDGHGKWHEIDLLVLGERRLHLVVAKPHRKGVQVEQSLAFDMDEDLTARSAEAIVS